MNTSTDWVRDRASRTNYFVYHVTDTNHYTLIGSAFRESGNDIITVTIKSGIAVSGVLEFIEVSTNTESLTVH